MTTKAEITFLAPSTRVNSNHLPLSELAEIKVYDNYGGNDTDNGESAEPSPDELPETKNDTQKPHREKNGRGGTRAKVASISGDDIRKGSFDLDLEPGVHLLSLVAADTEGRTADPSAPFRILVSEDSSKAILRKEDAPSEPGLASQFVASGTDPDRPSSVTKVSVRLL